MSNIIIVGSGRVGANLALMLSSHDNDVSIIDKNPEAFIALGRDFDGNTFTGVGYDMDLLEKAGIEECDFIAAVTRSDNVNLMVVEIARNLYNVPNAVARLYNPGHEDAYNRLGIDYVCGTTLVAQKIFSKIDAGLGDHVASFSDYEIIQFSLDLSSIRSDSIKITDFELKHKLRVCAFRRADGETSSIPSDKSILYHGDTLMVAVARDYLPKIKKFIKD